MRPVATRVLGADAKPRILRISPGQPAEQGGLQLREAIVSVDGEPVDTTSEVLARVAAHREGGIRLGVERDGHEEFVIVTPLVACKYGVVAVADDDVNAFADGEDIGINTGMIRFAESDDELALVIGHEFAHNALGHRARKTTNSVIGAVLGGLLDVGVAVVGVNTGGVFSKAGAGLMAGAFSKDFEGEADYLGLYLASRAGYDVSVAPDFWRRMGIEHPASVESKYLSMHPSTPERALSLEQVVAEIRAKREAGAPLEPTRPE
jgi:predicted Zn-dependent protease